MALAHTSQANAPQALDTQLHSTNPEEVALALARTLEAETLLHMAEKSKQPPSAETKAVLSALIAETFDLATDPDNLSRKRLIDRHLATYTESEAISEFYARLGHIRQIAGLIARDNMFRRMREKELPISGGVAELVARKTHLKTASDAVAMFGKPTFALTLTAHPTNVMGLESIRTQRALTKALDAVRDKKGSTEDVASAMRNYVRAPLLHTNKEGIPSRPNPMDETQQMLHALGCIYADLPHIYDRFDKPLAKRFGATYKPETLALNIDLSSWGSSGDKDGNKKVNATTTLYAMAAHKHEVISRYLKDLLQLKAPALEAWKATLEKADEAALRVMKMCEEQAPIMADADWNNARDILKKEATLDANAWVKSLESAYQESPSPDLLNLLRRARVFGFTMGRLEYRETASEFSRIAGLFITGYESLSEAEKQQKLNDLLNTPADTLKQKFQATLKQISHSGNEPYSKTDAHPIAAQTLKRMELARDFPDMVKDQVLAECQNTSNFLETLLLQKLVEKEGKKPQLGVVPLFEEYRVLERAPRIMDDALNNRHYKAHLEALAAQNGGKPTQQIQLAHSDNARRAGMPAARAYIYEAHKTLRQAVEKHGVNVQFFEGGSQSDPYRGGVRSMTASMNEFGIHDFAKFTFQGGDLINHLNYPGSIIRLFTRNIAHAADVLDNAAREQGSFSSRMIGAKKSYVDSLDTAATVALKKTAKDYEKRIFRDPRFGDFLRDIGYLEETEAGNRASRIPAREDTTSEVDVEKTRTIAFSEAFQHAGLCPTWIGAGTLYNNICDALGGDRVSAQTLHAMYKGSPVFADVIDRMLFGLAKPGMGALDEKFGASRMQQKLNAEYRDAFLLAMEAKTGKPYPDMSRDGGTSYGKLSFDEMSTIVLNEGLPHLKQTMQSNQRYMDTVERMKSTLAPNGRTLDETQKLLRALLHDAGDTVHHGRLLHADDHTYGQLMLHHEDAVKRGEKDPVASASAAYERTRDGGAAKQAGGRAA